MAKQVLDYDGLRELLKKPVWEAADKEEVLRFAGCGQGAADFFTPLGVADFMVSLVAPLLSEAPRILDPAAGSGRLLWACRQAWPKAQLHACEYAYTYREVLPKLLPDVDLAQEGDFLAHPAGKGDYDLVITNPPFGKQKGVHRAGLEAEFVLRALPHLKAGGLLVALIPDGILSSEVAREFRKGLLEEHSLLGVLSLPKEVFKQSGTGVKTSVLVASKGIHPATAADRGKAQVFMGLSEKCGWDSRGRMTHSDLPRLGLSFRSFLAEHYSSSPAPAGPTETPRYGGSEHPAQPAGPA